MQYALNDERERETESNLQNRELLMYLYNKTKAIKLNDAIRMKKTIVNDEGIANESFSEMTKRDVKREFVGMT